ncbi:mechanosensitive ion channel family protein [uncultured Erythrobacter sp.]|uniref:mechanosensitive ion channel family protein n=1 Tax=uncultured Erythrobacter sp. TaxID=263913 RepID=UPI00262418BB|nr:mechanosensitive ion channel [uncultured Erythrobacter sp.]
MFQTIFDQIDTMVESALASLPFLVIAAVILAITWIVAKFASRISARLIGKIDLRPSLRNLIETLVRLGVWITGMMLAALVVFPNFSPSGLLAGLGIGAVAIGFAFQDFFENFLAGVMIMLREKMQIGDVVKTGEIHGKVEFISLRESHIRAFSGELHVLPNSILFKDPLEVVTDLEERRFEVMIGVAYDTDLERASKVLHKAVEGVDLVSKEKDIQVLADNFGASSVDFRVRWWAASSGSEAVMNRDQVVRAIKRELDKADIEIPFPYITHTFKEAVPMKEKANAAF